MASQSDIPPVLIFFILSLGISSSFAHFRPPSSTGTPVTGAGTPTYGAETPTTGAGTPTTETETPTTGAGTPTTGAGTPTTGVGTPTYGAETPTTGAGAPGTGSPIAAFIPSTNFVTTLQTTIQEIQKVYYVTHKYMHF
jgi:hypothetical protein